MNKRKQQILDHASGQNKTSDTHRAALSGKRKFLRIAWIVMLVLSMVGWTIVVLFLNKTSWIDDNGFVHEPLFGLMPLSVFCFIIGAVLALLDGILMLIKSR